MSELQLNGFEDLLNKLHVVLPSMARRMAFNVDANVAAEGRIREQQEANQLQMGKPQRKGSNNYKVRSEWDSEVGWVSNSRRAKTGGTGFRMASFAWEVGKKYRVTAPYTNQLANLWAKETKSYSAASPIVGQKGATRVWKVGEKRPVRYDWTSVYQALAQSVNSAIVRTDKKFSDELRKV